MEALFRSAGRHILGFQKCQLIVPRSLNFAMHCRGGRVVMMVLRGETKFTGGTRKKSSYSKTGRD